MMPRCDRTFRDKETLYWNKQTFMNNNRGMLGIVASESDSADGSITYRYTVYAHFPRLMERPKVVLKLVAFVEGFSTWYLLNNG